MNETKILLSGLKISINHQFEFMKSFCKDYVSQFDTCDITATTNTDAVQKEKELVPTAPIEVCESLCIYRSIAEQLPQFNRFVFHGAAIEYNNMAYLFAAPSGTGKTTHINLWRKNLGDKVNIINGDKPIIHIGDSVMVYGTPWAGKEALERNTSAPINAICILKQSKTNNIARLSQSEALSHLMRQVYMPHNASALGITLGLLGKLLEKIPIYLLQCDISDEAFYTSFNEITKTQEV